ncbi:hypothetical protein PSC71_08425 [Devosia sp. J2-20]|uniref:hypothetical protein n=1 Tax=Devosia sp. J2-20 TaxID=3026161 RepID=UPI002499CF5F|nr:hypothetical protein [Devosia sp. J2-20]WDR00759.1 hypothetical protein PSC71_08425 [Devosia sp. J2-20]
MNKTIRSNLTTNVVACFTETAGGGSKRDINAPRNAPMKDPINHLDKVTWHSTFDQFELTADPTDVTVGHTPLATATTPIGVNTLIIHASSGARTTDILLFNHGLGYKPRAKVTIGGAVINAGQKIQDTTSYWRSVSVYVTTTGVYLREQAWAKDATLPAHNQTYRLYVFRQASPTPALPMFSKLAGLLNVARGVIRSDRKYLRRTGVGDEAFSMDGGPTIDIANGKKRTASGGVLTTEVGYTGSMAAPPFVTVGL